MSARLVGGGRRGQHQLARDRDALLDVLLADIAQRRIGEHGRDRQAGDRLPATAPGQCLALADRLDTLAGVFALGKRASGNKDPFGLRRAALGVVRILIETRIDLPLPEFLDAAVAVEPIVH